MTAADVQPSASVASTGKGVRYIGEHAYALSGAVGCTNAATPLLDFTTGSGVVVGKLFMNYCSVTATTDDMTFTVLINGQLIATKAMNESKEKENFPQYYSLLFSPFSRIEVKCQNISDSASRDMSAIFVGRVYGVE